MADDMSLADRVLFAQDFFRFAHRLGGPISFGQKFELPPMPEKWNFGLFSLNAQDFELTEETFELCGTVLERLAYRLLAMELNTALEDRFGSWKERRNHTNDIVRNASIVIWMIRNAVAHNILDPVWKIDDASLQNRKFNLLGVVEFDTTGLNGKRLKRLDFGGPIALFKLSEQLLPLVS